MTSNYIIREEKDPVAVLALDEICFPSDTRINLTDSFWWIVWKGKDPVGFAGLRPCKNPCNDGVGFLCRVGVVQTHRGKVLKKRLIKVREQKAKRIGIKELVTYCVPWNCPSVNSLISCGYRLYRPGSYWGGGGSVYLRKPIR